MAIEIFNRYEKKYLIDEDTCGKVESRLSEFMAPDGYNGGGAYTIASLYYDTPDNHMIRTSLQKPGYKEKLRLRAYGVPSAGDRVYVEIKKKVSGLTNKRRSALALEDARVFLETGVMPEPSPCQNRQVLSEVEYILRTQTPRPALYLAYDRRAWFAADGSGLRISFDRNIRTRRYDLRLEAGSHGDPLIADGQRLMEVKSGQSIPLWLSRLLSEYEIYPTSFSKYGKEYTQTLESASPNRVYTFVPANPSFSFTAACV